MIKQEVIDHYIAVNNLDQTAEYQSKMDRVLKLAKQMVNAEQFTKNIQVTVSDRDVKDFYEKQSKLVEVDGLGSAEEVFERIRQCIH